MCSTRSTSSRSLAAIACAAAVLTLAGGCSTLRTGPPVRFAVAETKALGSFVSPAPTSGRDAGFSVRLGDRILWLFGDTFPDEDTMLTATAAWASAASPSFLDEPVDAQGRPFELYPYSAEERAFNEAHAEPPECCFEYAECPLDDRYCRCGPNTDCAARYALWPGVAVARDDDRILNFYEKVLVGAARWDFTVIGTGAAFIDEGRVIADRIFEADGAARMLFPGAGPKFLHGLLIDTVGGKMVYLYGESGHADCSVDVYLARAPLERAHETAAWQFRSADGWRTRLEDARPILHATEGGIGSVAWNDYLGTFVAGTMSLCTTGASFIMRQAANPDGPWSAPIAIDFGEFGATRYSYAGMLHPALGTERLLVASFYQPEVREDFPVGKVQLVALELVRHSARNAGGVRTRGKYRR